MGMNRIKKRGDTVEISVEVYLFQEDDAWIAYCPALDLSAYADDIDSAEVAFDESLDLVIEETVENGTFEKYLLSLGWQIQNNIPKYTPPQIQFNRTASKQYTERITIPMC